MEKLKKMYDLKIKRYILKSKNIRLQLKNYVKKKIQ